MALNDSSCINNHRYSVFGAACRDVLKQEKHPPAILSDLNSCTIELHFLYGNEVCNTLHKGYFNSKPG